MNNGQSSYSLLTVKSEHQVEKLEMEKLTLFMFVVLFLIEFALAQGFGGFGNGK